METRLTANASTHQAPPGTEPTAWLVGASGYGNLGDDLIALAATRWARDAYPGHAIAVVGNGPGAYPSNPAHRSYEELLNYLEFEGARQADTFVLAGGGLTWSVEATARWANMADLSQACGWRTVATRIGFEVQSPSLESLFLRKFDSVTFRDQRSLDEALRVAPRGNFSLSEDFVTTYGSDLLAELGIARQRSVGGRLRVGIALNRTLHMGHPQLEHLTHILGGLSAESELVILQQVRHLTHPAENDLVTWSTLQAGLESVQGLHGGVRPSLTNWLEQIASVDVVLTQRLHTAIVAECLGIAWCPLGDSTRFPDEVPLKLLDFASAKGVTPIALGKHWYEVVDSATAAIEGMLMRMP